MKQEDLARLVGVRRETIGNLEKGRYNPSLVLAWNIAKVFNVTIEEIFTVEYPKEAFFDMQYQERFILCSRISVPFPTSPVCFA